MKNEPSYYKEIRKNHIRVFLLCLCGILINYILSNLTNLLKLPIWLDTAGTILAGIYGGYLPGIFTGFVTNLLKGITDFSSIYYAVLNVLIAVISTLLYKSGFLKKWYKILLFILILAVIGGGIGGVLPQLLTGFKSSGFINDFLYDLLDKSITIILVLIVYKLVPKKFAETLYFRGWKQTPLSNEEITEIKKIKCKSLFLRSKIMMILTVALIALAIVATTISFILYKNSLITEYTQIANGVANQAVQILDSDRIDEYISMDETNEEYIKVENQLSLIRGTCKDVEYLYVYKIEEDGCHVVFDLDTEEVEGGLPGEIIPFDESFTPLLPKLFAGEEIDPVITDDSYGWLLTVYKPIFNSENKCVCYVGTDISMQLIANNELTFFTQMVFLFLGFVILIVAIVVWFVDYTVVYPINSMTLRTSEFAYNAEDALEENVEKIKNLDIHTGDEVENLYHAFLKMTQDTMGYVEEIVNSAERIAQIHNTFGKVVAPEVRDYLLSDNPDLGGKDFKITIMFCDIRGFTTISENLEPKEIVTLLNKYFTKLEKPIAQYGGIINKYIGDAIMVVFGAPLASKTHAEDALKAAVEMRAQLEELNKEFRKQGLPEFHFGIGLNSGKVLAGNIGTSSRLEYTVIGDAVNTASRIESLCKTYNTDLLISQNTAQLLPEDIQLKFIDEAEIRGKQEKIKLYSY